jgi:DUF4097 and DUF4098 domain-containing protein YvlB
MAEWLLDHPDRLTLDGLVERLEVGLIAGRLNVVGTDGPARVEASQVGRRKVVVQHDGGVLRVRHERGRRWPGLFWWLGVFGRGTRVDISIAVPRKTRADLRLTSGSMVASGLADGVRADVTSGRITLLGIGGTCRAKTISGPIEALNIDGDLELETTSGEITLADSAAGRVRAKTVSGAITCDLDNPHDSDISLDTTSGEITARVREDSDLDVELHAISGRVTSAFREVPTGNSHTVRGSLGAGTGRLSASAVSGNISLLRRPVDYDEPGEEMA